MTAPSGDEGDQPDPALQFKARIAILLDHFHLRPADIAELTTRQIDELYFHRRDRQGQIVMPGSGADARFKTCQDELNDKAKFFQGLKGMGLTISDEEGVMSSIKRKWAAKPKSKPKTFRSQP